MNLIDKILLQENINHLSFLKEGVEEDARKYDTVEEFIEAQGDVVYRGKGSENEYATNFYFSKNKSYADKFGNSKEYIVNLKNPYKADFEINHINVNRFANSKKSLDHDGIIGLDAGTNEEVIVTFGKSKFKTKQQLIEIWNSVHE